MSSSAEQIADQIRIAAKESPKALTVLLGGLWTDTFSMEHVPPAPGDGLVERDRMNHMAGLEMELFGREIANYRYDDVDVSVDGDEIHMTSTIAGTLPDGATLAIANETTLTVVGDQINRAVARADMDAVGPLHQLIMESGIFSDLMEG